MSNETRYVRILPSAVESKYWEDAIVGAILPVKPINSLYQPELLVLCSPLSPDISYCIEEVHTQEVFVYDEPREVVQPKQWRLKVDVPEWGLKKGQQTDNVVAGFAKFSWQDYTASIPLSMMPYIADPVGEDESQTKRRPAIRAEEE